MMEGPTDVNIRTARATNSGDDDRMSFIGSMPLKVTSAFKISRFSGRLDEIW